MKFSHSGLIGDIIYHLPIIKHLGGGELYIFPFGDYLWGGRQIFYNHRNGILFDNVRSLLEVQPYLTKVAWSETPVGVCFEGWRKRYVDFSLNLTQQAALWLGIEIPDHCPPWLTVPDSKQIAPVVISRTCRNLHQSFPWKRVLDKFKGNVVFIGFKDEYDAFVAENGSIPHYQTANMLEVARVIAGSNLFIGSASSPLAVAEGLKHNCIAASYPPISHCVYFNRPHVQHCWDIVHLDLFHDDGRAIT